MHESYDYGLWTVVVINALIFLAFAVGFLRPKKKYEWHTLGVFTAFIVALFTEMYGFPLTIFILLSFFGDTIGIKDPFLHVNGHLLGTLFGASELIKYTICILGSIVMFYGLYLLSVGWSLIHNSPGKLMTTGIYSKIRHPQYSAILLIAVGMLIQWPTFLTLLISDFYKDTPFYSIN